MTENAPTLSDDFTAGVDAAKAEIRRALLEAKSDGWEFIWRELAIEIVDGVDAAQLSRPIVG